MIRFLICLECLLLAILALGWLDLAPAGVQLAGERLTGVHLAGERPKAAGAMAPTPAPTPAPVVAGTLAATVAQPAGAGAMGHDDRIAIARDLLGGGDAPPPAPLGAVDAQHLDEAPAGAPAGDVGAGAPAGDVGAGAPPGDVGGTAAGAAVAAGTPGASAADGRREAEATNGRVAEAATGVAAGAAAGGHDRAAEPASPGQPSPARVAAVQRLLAQLGFRPGASDGALGPRTEQAIRAYQQRAGERVDGRVSDRLLARLQRDAHQLAAQNRTAGSARARGETSGSDRPSGVLATILGGYQRLVGHQFDSVRRPGELRAYCRSQPDTWIYDEGRHDLRYCGHIAPNRDG